MLSAKRVVVLVIAVAVLAVAAWWVRPSGERPATPTVASDDRRAILPPGSPSEFFTPRQVGDPIIEKRRPQISNVQIADLDRDGLPDVLVCDVTRNQVTWIRQSPRGTYTEMPVGASIRAPAHVEAMDFDR